MRLHSAIGLLVASAALFAGCGNGGDTSADADTATANALRDSARQHQREQAKLAEDSFDAEADAAVAATERETAAREAQGSRGGESDGGSESAAEDEGDGETATRSSTSASASAATGGLLSAADRTSFKKLGASLSGVEGIAVVAAGKGGQVYKAGTLTTGVAWSTSKVPVAMAAIDAGVGTQADLKLAITASDNAAAERLWTALGSSAASKATQAVRDAGDPTTTIQSKRLRGSAYTAFGQTQWALTNQARFAAGLVCGDTGGQVLTLMQNTISAQRWGLGTIGSGRSAMKGGWGPGVNAGKADGWMDRQMGVVTIKGKRLGVAIATTASEHGTGTANLSRIAKWLQSNVDVKSVPSTPAC